MLSKSQRGSKFQILTNSFNVLISSIQKQRHMLKHPTAHAFKSNDKQLKYKFPNNSDDQLPLGHLLKITKYFSHQSENLLSANNRNQCLQL